MYTPQQHEPNQRDNFRLYPRLRGGRSDTYIDIRRLLDAGYPKSLSFDRGLRFRRRDGGVVFWGRWRDSVGCRCVGSQCRGNNGFERGLTGFLRLMNESVRLPTTTH
jgi:hypothetical protein